MNVLLIKVFFDDEEATFLDTDLVEERLDGLDHFGVVTHTHRVMQEVFDVDTSCFQLSAGVHRQSVNGLSAEIARHD